MLPSRQELWDLLLAHFAIRGLMHEAALRADRDPGRFSFLHAVRVVRRTLPLVVVPSRAKRALHEAVLVELLEECVASSWSRGVKRKMSNYKPHPHNPQSTVQVDFATAIRILR
jgi:hypothetical protein